MYGVAVYDGLYLPLDYPAEFDVRDGVVYAFGEMVGNLVLPDPEDVRGGVDYGGGGGEFTGTMPKLIRLADRRNDGVYP